MNNIGKKLQFANRWKSIILKTNKLKQETVHFFILPNKNSKLKIWKIFFFISLMINKLSSLSTLTYYYFQPKAVNQKFDKFNFFN